MNRYFISNQLLETKKKSPSIRGFLLLLFFFCFLALGMGQEFEKAPLPKVKMITEWVQVGKSKKAIKGMVYNFDRQGNLTSYKEEGQKGYPGTVGKISHDRLGRIKTKTIKYGYNNTISRFAYKSDYFVEEIEFKDSRYKKFHYHLKGDDLLELKTFIANYDTDYKYQIFERTVFSYDRKKRLKSKTLYNYWNVRDKRVNPDSKKTQYEYVGNSNNLNKIKEFNYKGKLNNIITFKYDKKGKLLKKNIDFLNGNIETTSFRYKNGKIWTEVFSDGYLVITKIYKNNRLIRKRKKWNGVKEEIIDFQYTFF